MIIGAVLGLVFFRPGIQLQAVTSFKVGTSYMFPILFVTVACGAISGFHSLISSGTSSKQIDSEKDLKLIGYGAMLIEGVLAVIALITAAYIGGDRIAELLKAGGPTNVFADGVGTFMTKIGIDLALGKSFVALAVSAFALTSLDSGTRIGRFIFQEFFDKSASKPGSTPNKLLTNRYFATLVTVFVGGWLGAGGYAKVWPVFGSANQLLAALALLATAAWLKKEGRAHFMLKIPMVFMFTVTLTALVLLVKANLAAANYPLVVFGSVLFVLALVLIKLSYKILFTNEVIKPNATK
jgi:carbon starvation protein